MRPRPLALGLGCAWAVLGLAAAFVPALVGLWSALGAVAGLGLALDLVLALRRTPLRVERQAPSSLALDTWTSVRLTVLQPGGRTERVTVFDGYPPQTDVEGLPREVVVPAQSGVVLEYRLRAVRRGAAVFSPVEVLRVSPLRLWDVRERTRIDHSLRIYPNFTAVVGFALHALENRMQLLGIRRRQRRGEGMEFRQMRDYQAGDSLRQIDWKATSRRQKTISREYQEERDQQVVFLLDCGRRMRAVDGALSHFDHCLNALLLVAYVALRQGDSVSLLTFGGVERRLPPLKGRQSMTALLNAVYDLEATLEPPDYLEAATRLRATVRRRALVVVITNQRDEDEDELGPALELLRARHLVVLASLRETSVQDLLEGPVEDLEAALARCAAMDYAQSRRRALERHAGRGVLALDVAPSELQVALAEKYLEIKRAGQL
jgi:uncharacterized protein (DUF58 family)